MNPFVLGTLFFLAAGVAGAFQESPESEPPRVWLDMRASEVIGAPVQNARGQSLGEVEELVVHTDGTVRYAVLSFDEEFGFGGKLFPFELGSFRPVIGTGRLQLNVERERLTARPGFAADRWPDFHDDYWLGIDPASRDFARASVLIGRDVVNRGGNELGEVEDLVVNFGTGRVRYIVVEHDAGGATAYLPRELAFQSDELVLRPSR